MVEGLEEGGVEDDGFGIAEEANLVFQSAVVEARLAAYGGIDHRQQRGGDIDEGQAALEGADGKAAQVGDHAAAEVYY